MPVVYLESLCKRHVAPRFGTASLARFGLVLGSAVLATVAAYSVGGLWPREGQFRTHPKVEFKHDVVMVMQGQEKEAIFTTLPNLEAAMDPDRVAAATLTAIPHDGNSDGKPEFFDVAVKATPGFDVHGFKLLMAFDYELDGRAKMETTALAYATMSSAVPGAVAYVDGELKLKLANALLDNARRAVYTETPLKDIAASNAPVSPQNVTVVGLLSEYLLRNDTVTYDYTGSWEGGGDGRTFEAVARVRVPPHQVVPIRLRALEMLKWGWVQVFSFLAVFLFLSARFEAVLFHHRLVPTRVVSDLDAKEHRF